MACIRFNTVLVLYKCLHMLGYAYPGAFGKIGEGQDSFLDDKRRYICLCNNVLLVRLLAKVQGMAYTVMQTFI